MVTALQSPALHTAAATVTSKTISTSPLVVSTYIKLVVQSSPELADMTVDKGIAMVVMEKGYADEAFPAAKPNAMAANATTLLRLVDVIDPQLSQGLDAAATICLILHLRISKNEHRPTLVSGPALLLYLNSNLIISQIRILFTSPAASSSTAAWLQLLTVFVPAFLRISLLSYVMAMTFSLGDGLRMGPRDDRLEAANDGASWQHSDIAWAVALASFAVSYFEYRFGIFWMLATYALFLRTPFTLPLSFLLLLSRSLANLLLAAASSSRVPVGVIVYELTCVALYLLCTIVATLIRARMWGARYATRDAASSSWWVRIGCMCGGGEDDDSGDALEYLMEAEEDELDDVIREGLDWGVDGTPESLPAYTPKGANDGEVARTSRAADAAQEAELLVAGLLWDDEGSAIPAPDYEEI
ncbi:hypothetical protein HK101_011799 [Irineochytrium annulatum]|nr:hypothetical protein HK101_011799 [Irineochytrium annulatum]